MHPVISRSTRTSSKPAFSLLTTEGPGERYFHRPPGPSVFQRSFCAGILLPDIEQANSLIDRAITGGHKCHTDFFSQIVCARINKDRIIFEAGSGSRIIVGLRCKRSCILGQTNHDLDIAQLCRDLIIILTILCIAAVITPFQPSCGRTAAGTAAA